MRRFLGPFALGFALVLLGGFGRPAARWLFEKPDKPEEFWEIHKSIVPAETVYQADGRDLGHIAFVSSSPVTVIAYVRARKRP